MNVLAFDTSTPLLSLAVETAAGRFYSARDIGLRHGELLMPLIGQMLAEAGISAPELDLIVCSRGPGSFTGLRIGMASAKGLSAGTGAPVVSIPLPDYLARPYRNLKLPLVVVIDAKKRRFYGAFFRQGIREGDYFDLDAAAIAEAMQRESELVVTGPDAPLLIDRLDPEARSRFTIIPSGIGAISDLLDAGLDQYSLSGADRSDQGPLYIRKSEAEISLEERRGVER